MELFLKDVAFSAGMTQFQYGCAIFNSLEKGQIIDLLNIEGQADICDWINSQKLLNGKPFCLEIHIPVNKLRIVVLYATCQMNLRGDEPLALAKEIRLGIPHRKPKIFDSLPSYVITLPMLIKEECPKEG